MATRLAAVVVEALDVAALGRFWAGALGWAAEGVPDGGQVTVGPPGPDGVALLFVPSDRPKAGKNRLHLDLSGGTDQAGRVGALLRLGAVRADIGQGDVPWEVLADPEGNEFCVLPGSEAAAGLAAVCQDAGDAAAQGRFWAAATGWPVETEQAWGVRLRPPAGTGTALVMGPPVATGTNRLRFGLAAGPGGPLTAEVARLLAAGAGRSDGPGPVTLTDPEGNAFHLYAAGKDQPRAAG